MACDETHTVLQGEVLAEKLVIPRLRVRKDWFKGLNNDPIDHSHPDIGIHPDAQDGPTGAAHCPISQTFLLSSFQIQVSRVGVHTPCIMGAIRCDTKYKLRADVIADANTTAGMRRHLLVDVMDIPMSTHRRLLQVHC
jgi:hypothetical protein